MKKLFILLLPVLLLSCSDCKKEPDSELRNTIYASMEKSREAWNNGDLVAFMHNYHQSDSIVFMGKTSITYGWQNTLDRYIKGYPNKDYMGHLDYDFISLEYLGKDHLLQIGKYTLTRKTDTVSGHFSLIWKRFGKEWLIIRDHSS